MADVKEIKKERHGTLTDAAMAESFELILRMLLQVTY